MCACVHARAPPVDCCLFGAEICLQLGFQVVTLNSVSVIVAEYIPFGANQIAQMNQNLGSTDRVQGGFFTAVIDADSSSAFAAVVCVCVFEM